MTRALTFYLLLAVAWLAPLAPAAAQQKATTVDGRQVYLSNDGTWRYADALDLSQVKIKVLPAPPWSARLAQVNTKPTRLRLRQVSAKRNQIIDDAAWFKEHGLALPVYLVPNAHRNRKGDCPARTPTSFKGKMLISAIRLGGRLLLIYGQDFASGRYLVITDEKLSTVQAALDFDAYVRGPKGKAGNKGFSYQALTWATVADGVLYVVTGHSTYASVTDGRNAYLTALDLGSGKLLWRSKPLVCNAQNFLVVEDAVICGYGFTDEPDHLMVLDRASGKVVQRLKLKTGPSFILRKEDRLLVRTYNMDYQFKIKRPAARKAKQ